MGLIADWNRSMETVSVKGCNPRVFISPHKEPSEATSSQPLLFNLPGLNWHVLFQPFIIAPPSSLPIWEPVSMTTSYRRGLPAGGRVYRSSVGITARNLQTASRPEWNGRKGQERACTYLRFVGFTMQAATILNKSWFRFRIFAFGMTRWKIKKKECIYPAESPMV